MGYTATARTTTRSKIVLEQLEHAATEAGLLVQERSPSYLNLGPQKNAASGVTLAIGAGVLVVMAILAFLAVSPLVIVLLPLSLVPAIPFLVLGKGSVTVAAFPSGDETLVTADGSSSDLVGQVIDKFFAELPGRASLAPPPVAEVAAQEKPAEAAPLQPKQKAVAKKAKPKKKSAVPKKPVARRKSADAPRADGESANQTDHGDDDSL